MRVRSEVQLSTPPIGYVGVELRRREVGVSEHLLDAAQIRAAFEQVCRERVPEQVRVHALRLEPRLLGELAQEQEGTGTGERTAATRAACRGRRPGAAEPATWMPSRRRNPAKAPAASAAGVVDLGRKLRGSSASCGAPERVSRPWSTSSEVIGVTLPVLM